MVTLQEDDGIANDFDAAMAFAEARTPREMGDALRMGSDRLLHDGALYASVQQTIASVGGSDPELREQLRRKLGFLQVAMTKGIAQAVVEEERIEAASALFTATADAAPQALRMHQQILLSDEGYAFAQWLAGKLLAATDLTHPDSRELNEIRTLKMQMLQRARSAGVEAAISSYNVQIASRRPRR